MNDFVFIVDDVFYISGKGTVVTGMVVKGSIVINQTAYVCQEDGRLLETTISGIEMFRKKCSEVFEGTSCGLLLMNTERHDVARGCYIFGSIPQGYVAHSESGIKKSWFQNLFQ